MSGRFFVFQTFVIARPERFQAVVISSIMIGNFDDFDRCIVMH